MKQKIVINVVKMNCEKCKSKAMKIAVKAKGVTKVEIQGEHKDQLVVIGDEVDSVKLTRSLRKEFQYANLLSVQEEKEKKEEKKEEITLMQWPTVSYYQQYPIPCDPNPSCSIM
ncbi:heavy metal-associated isoprenylated plant protein 47-like [Pistacia vera]|uniref:heavy metal-associated isoprenylated plant protein 47-like n=1 Tax=Pistacia vera TaxID=55513 RepID=UPI001262E539|nr:heavy metal-associated isoprenylated plant protein 47-like [Pistacia vera]